MTTRQPSVAVQPGMPWERRPAESIQAFEAFALYRDLGPSRSLRSVANQLHKSVTMLGRWSRTHDWIARCDIWDAERDRQNRSVMLASHRQAIVDMGKRHADTARSWLATMDRVIAEVMRRFIEDPTALRGVPLVDLLALARTAGSVLPRVAEMERVALGVSPTEPVDEMKLRASITAEIELRSKQGGSETEFVAPDAKYLSEMVRALIEAGAVDGAELTDSSV